jgi:hypothetical protein
MLKVTLAALPAPGLWWNIYVETAAGSDVYKLWGISYTGAILMVDSYGLGRVPPTAKASGALEITQYNFAQKFLGLAHQRKDASAVRCYGSSEDNVLIAHTAGLFPADCASATFAYGDPVGAAKQSGNLLESQKVVGVADISLGIGYYVGKGGASLTNIEIEIVTKLAPSWRQPIGLAA